MSCDTVYGWQGKWAFEHSNAAASTTSTSAFDDSSERFQVVTDTMGLQETFVHSSGMRGQRGEQSEPVYSTINTYEGEMVIECSPKALGFFLRHITGTPATGPYVLAESTTVTASSLFGFDYIRYDGANNKIFRNVEITKVSLKASSGSLVMMTLSLVGYDEERDAADPTTSWPDWPTSTAYDPYISHESTISAGSPGASRNFDDWEIVIDHLKTARHYMNVDPVCYNYGGRVVMLNGTLDFSDTVENELDEVGVAGAAATITLTRAAMSTIFALTKVQWPKQTPGLTGKAPIKYMINGVARGTVKAGGTPAVQEILITHDETP